MPAWRDAPAVSAFLHRVSRRIAWLGAARGAAAGLGLALMLLAIGWLGRESAVSALGTGGALALAGAVIGTRVAMADRRTIAARVERQAAECRNVLVTASELIERPGNVREYIGQRVCGDAARVTSRLDITRLFPARRILAVLASALVLWTVAVATMAGRPSAVVGRGAVDGPPAITRVDVVVTPPAYTKRPSQTLRDPARITAMAGSRVQLTVSATAAQVTLETVTSARQTLTATSARVFTGEIVADTDGFLAVEPGAADGRAGLRKLIGLSVEPDRSPRVRVTAPGKDLFLPDTRPALDLTVDADDDLGLSSIKVRYTRVAGSGESFTFTDGEVPLEITRSNDRAWTARGALRLSTLDLGPGDMVVYRAVATDARPGAAPAESDSWVVEIIAPGAVAMEGFAVDDERDRYALSQQMVIMKTEQLATRKAAMTPEAFGEEAQNIASEQRRVRAEFVFMMGGELADAGIDIGELHEEEEAAGEHDLAAGRLANQGRTDLLRAIRSMSLAATSLMTADVPKALVDERAALASLQRAFARSRYILRTLTVRERLDLSRRLTGVLAALVRNTRPIEAPPENPRLTDLRRALVSLAALAGTETFAQDDGARASALAQSVLRIDPASEPLGKVAGTLGDSASAIAAGRTDDARRLLASATMELATVTRAELSAAPPRPPTPGIARLEGLLGDGLRRRVK
jgi:hypothetical protein